MATKSRMPLLRNGSGLRLSSSKRLRKKGTEYRLNLNSEVEEGFLRSGTAKTAVPPVEMTDFGQWMVWKKPTSANLGLHRIII
jgi:hypothetical protein